MSENELIRLKKDVTLRQITDCIWQTAEEWHSLLNKQTFVNEMTERFRKVVEEKGK